MRSNDVALCGAAARFMRWSLNVTVCAKRFGVMGDLYVAVPKNSYSSVAFFGIFICRMVSIRSGSGCTPSASTEWNIEGGQNA